MPRRLLRHLRDLTRCGDDAPPTRDATFRQELDDVLHRSLGIAPLVYAAAVLVGLVPQVLFTLPAEQRHPEANLAAAALFAACWAAARGERGKCRARLISVVLALGIAVLVGVTVARTGGLASDSWVAATYGMVGLALLLPLTGEEMLGTILAILSGYALGVTAAARPIDPALLAARSASLAIGALLSLAAAKVTTRLRRQEFEARAELEAEEERSRSLLENILPAPVIARLKDGAESLAEDHDAVTVLFADIVGFTPLAADRSAGEVVELLDDLFGRFDVRAAELGLEKIKTIGDCYMVAAGVPLAREDHLEAGARMGLALLEETRRFREDRGVDVDVRVGLHTGPAVAGVIGRTKFAYDLWGDAVNTASRMESHGEPGRVHLTAVAREGLPSGYALESRGTIEVKGKGPMETWFLDAA